MTPLDRPFAERVLARTVDILAAPPKSGDSITAADIDAALGRAHDEVVAEQGAYMAALAAQAIADAEAT
jgi:hypothetical protein